MAAPGVGTGSRAEPLGGGFLHDAPTVYYFVTEVSAVIHPEQHKMVASC